MGIKFLQHFGPPIYGLVALSIFLLAIVLERFWVYCALPRLNKVDRVFIPKRLQPIYQIINRSRQANDGEAISMQLVKIRHQLQSRLMWLNLIALIAPMVGLLGTIWGLSHSMEGHPANQLTLMIHYLSVALWATAIGIFIAVASLILLYVYRYWSESYLMRLEQRIAQDYYEGYV